MIRILAVFFSVTLLAQAAGAQQPLMEGTVEAISAGADFRAEANGEIGNVVHWARREERLGARYLRLHFSGIEDASSRDYAIVVRDRDGRIVERLSKADFGAKSSMWTKLVYGDLARVEVVGPEPPVGLKFRLDKLVVQRNMGAPFAIVLPDEREPVAAFRALPVLYSRARAVAKLTFVAGGVAKSCTGFLVSDDRFVTNEHCVSDSEVCDSAVATFGYEVDESGALRPGDQYQCSQFVGASHELDVALITLAGFPGHLWGKLPLADNRAEAGSQLYIVQHPGGEPKQVSRKDCFVSTPSADGNARNTDFGHKCDTLGGSSGSPVMNNKFEVVGLHHFGFGPSGQWTNENRAVHIKAISQWLAER